MSELRFTCPACGQHMQCEKAYVGHEIPCPNCNTQLRVPFSDGAGGSPNALPRAQVVLNADTQLNPALLGDAEQLREAKANASEIPLEISVGSEKETSKGVSPFNPVEEAPAAPTQEQPRERQHEYDVHCICQVCQSELRVRRDEATNNKPHLAEVVPKNASPPPQAAEEKPDLTTANPDSLSLAERERQIAIARASQNITRPTLKPRLSYILSGGEKVKPGETGEPKPTDNSSPEKSFPE